LSEYVATQVRIPCPIHLDPCRRPRWAQGPSYGPKRVPTDIRHRCLILPQRDSRDASMYHGKSVGDCEHRLARPSDRPAAGHHRPQQYGSILQAILASRSFVTSHPGPALSNSHSPSRRWRARPTASRNWSWELRSSTGPPIFDPKVDPIVRVGSRQTDANGSTEILHG